MPRGGTLVFVYGTLRHGGVYHHILAHEEFIGNVAVEGEMFSIHNRYPGAHFGPTGGLIQGELWKVGPHTLERMDDLEGYDEKRPETSMYVRRKVHVVGLEREVWTYEYRTEGAQFPRVPSGDWTRYIKMREGD